MNSASDLIKRAENKADMHTSDIISGTIHLLRKHHANALGGAAHCSCRICQLTVAKRDVCIELSKENDRYTRERFVMTRYEIIELCNNLETLRNTLEHISLERHTLRRKIL